MSAGSFAIKAFLLIVPGCAVLIDGMSAHDIARIALIAVSGICALSFAAGVAANRGNGGGSKTLALCAIALLVLALIAVRHAPDPVAAAREFAVIVGLASVAAVIAINRGERRVDALAMVIVSGALLYGGLVLLIVLSATVGSGRLDPSLVVLGYDNYRLFSHVQTVMLPLLALVTTRSIRRGELARVAWAALTIHLALLIFTFGRATALSVVGAALLSLLLFRRAALAQARHLLIGTALAAVLYVSLFVALPLFAGSSTPALVPGGLAGLQSDHSRLLLWRLALDYVAQEPWLGIGPMHYAHYLNPKAAHPHNVYLQLASEWGVPMLLGIVILCVWGAWRMARTIRACADPHQATVGVALFTTMMAIAIDGMFSGNFVMPVSQMWIAVALGWAMGWTRANAPARSNIASQGNGWSMGPGFATLAVVSQAWLCWSIRTEVTDLNAHLQQIGLDVSKSFTACPRFWSNGWF